MLKTLLLACALLLIAGGAARADTDITPANAALSVVAGARALAPAHKAALDGGLAENCRTITTYQWWVLPFAPYVLVIRRDTVICTTVN